MGYYVAGPPLLNGRCTSLLRVVISEMTYTVLCGTLNSSTPYHTIQTQTCMPLFLLCCYNIRQMEWDRGDGTSWQLCEMVFTSHCAHSQHFSPIYTYTVCDHTYSFLQSRNVWFLCSQCLVPHVWESASSSMKTLNCHYKLVPPVLWNWEGIFTIYIYW